MDIVKAKLDIIFKKLFTSDNEILKAFVADLIDIPIEDITQITVDNPNIVPSVYDGKQSQLDLKMNVDDKIVNVEIQLCDKGNFRERSLYYWSKIFSGELKKGEDYSELKKTISINILNFNLFDCEEFHSKFSMLEETRHELLTDKCSVLFFELKKLSGKVDKNDRRKLWLQLVNAETEEELNMLDNTGVPEIKKAVVILHEMSADEEMREIARLREKAEHD
ncbi:MAG: Rpn family recombination-promoting nuclease/putative transposase, partial [Oscillospiraceae bacterium]|nr:Rpn family recombination-promoting nuclease/putative transposase [Oscillospiraceae bacterium]